MKAYSKTLKPELIDRLNRLYKEKGSWWQTIVDDDQVFILTRDNHLRVLVHGGLLLMITMDRQGKLVCKTHEEFLHLRSVQAPYVTITENNTEPPNRVEGLGAFVKHYEKIKRRIKLFVGKERQYCHAISLNIREIVEKEAGLVLEKEDGKKAQFVDLQAVRDDGTMVFVEAKLFENKEIHSAKTPPVVKQLKKYEGIIKSHKQKIIDAYAEQYKTYSQLDGKFFQKKLPHPDRIQINPTVKLIITDFNGTMLKHMMLGIRENIENGMGWKNNSDNLITVGNPKLINAKHIFKGV